MLPATVSITSILIAWLGHHWGEKIFTRNGRRQLKIIIKGYHVHHSCFGIVAIIGALVAASAVSAAMLVGYGIGNIWQHKHTHNRVNEKGFVFISKVV